MPVEPVHLPALGGEVGWGKEDISPTPMLLHARRVGASSPEYCILQGAGPALQQSLHQSQFSLVVPVEGWDRCLWFHVPTLLVGCQYIGLNREGQSLDQVQSSICLFPLGHQMLLFTRPTRVKQSLGRIGSTGALYSQEF